MGQGIGHIALAGWFWVGLWRVTMGVAVAQSQGAVQPVFIAWWEAGAAACPKGAVLRGKVGQRLACVKPNGTPHGRTRVWYPGGGPAEDTNYFNGKEHGRSVLWHENGERAAEMFYKNGKLDGRAVTCRKATRLFREPRKGDRSVAYYDNGQLAELIEYKDDKPYKQWRGCLKASESDYVDGQFHGRVTTWYPNGVKATEVHYKYGKEDGTSTMWYDNGRKASKVEFRAGMENGLSVSWFSYSPKIAAQGIFVDGLKDGRWIFNGGRRVEIWREGTLVDTIYRRSSVSSNEPSSPQ